MASLKSRVQVACAAIARWEAARTAAFRARGRAIRKTLDSPAGIFFMGWAMVVGGVAMQSASWALVCGGGLLIGVVLGGALKKA